MKQKKPQVDSQGIDYQYTWIYRGVRKFAIWSESGETLIVWSDS